MRKVSTPAEKLLWKQLRGKKLSGLKFRRQHPLDKFVVDFYCHEKKLVIELDEGVHDVQVNKEYDEARTEMLARLNICVLRFRNEEILNNMDTVLRKISEAVDMLD